MKLLRTLARDHGKTVLTSIHQPSSAVFQAFDRLLMLSEGCVVYFGTPIESMQYLREQNLGCPDGYNAADHWMDLLVQDSAIDEDNDDDDYAEVSDELPGTLRRRRGDQGRKKGSPRLLLEQAWDDGAVAEEMDRAVDNADAKTDSTESLLVSKKYNTSWWTQYTILTHRALKNSRSAIFTPLNLMKSMAIGIVAGVLWFNTKYTERNVNNIRSYYFFTMTFWVFDAMFTALTAFPSERDVILKERASGSYQ